jgi:hypothetical protein
LKAGSVIRLTENTTSSAVSGVPSWNLMSLRSVNSVVLSSTWRHAAATWGTILPSLSRVSMLSKILR